MEPTYEELAAQICSIKEAIDNLRAARGYYARTTAWMVVNGAVNTTPAACLAQVRAGAVEQFAKHYFNMFEMTPTANAPKVKYEANEYAARILKEKN
jgi:hypothetical protein